MPETKGSPTSPAENGAMTSCVVRQSHDPKKLFNSTWKGGSKRQQNRKALKLQMVRAPQWLQSIMPIICYILLHSLSRKGYNIPSSNEPENKSQYNRQCHQKNFPETELEIHRKMKCRRKLEFCALFPGSQPSFSKRGVTVCALYADSKCKHILQSPPICV